MSINEKCSTSKSVTTSNSSVSSSSKMDSSSSSSLEESCDSEWSSSIACVHVAVVVANGIVLVQLWHSHAGLCLLRQLHKFVLQPFLQLQPLVRKVSDRQLKHVSYELVHMHLFHCWCLHPKPMINS